MTSLRAWHSTVGTLVTVALVLMFFTDDWSLATLALAAGATAFLGGNFFFAFRGRARQSERRLWDLAEFKNHEDFSLAAARDLWAEEKSDSVLDLRVKLRGKATALEPAKAPLSKSVSVAWRLTVDTYRKTRLGAEGDLTPLLDRTELSLKLADQGESVLIEPPGLLNAGAFREELTTWQGLEQYPAVKALAEEAVTLQGLNKEHFPGLRIRETRVEPGEPITAYGTLSHTPQGFVLRGNDVLDDAGSLLVVADRARDKLRLRQRRSWAFWVNALLLVASLPVLALTLGLDFLPLEKTGKVRITPGARHLAVTFQTPDAAPDVWTFDPDDKRTLVSLTSNDEDWSTGGSTLLTLTTFGGTVQDYGLGKPAKLSWQDGHWLLDTGPDKNQGRRGTLLFQNKTAQTITLTFPDSPVVNGYTWSLDPHEGQNSANRIVFDDKDWPLPEGALVVLETGETVARHLTAGISPELKWDAAARTWNLEITADSLKAGLSPLWAVPHPSLHLRGVVHDPLEDQPITFDLAPGSGPAHPVRSVVGDEYTLGEGQVLEVRQTEETILYSGPLANCPWAKWNRDHWELRP